MGCGGRCPHGTQDRVEVMKGLDGNCMWRGLPEPTGLRGAYPKG